MLIEPCGGPNCVSMVNSTTSTTFQRTKLYNFSQCGMPSNTKYSMVNKALQFKVSTGVKNTLRPAEYPWLVSDSLPDHSFQQMNSRRYELKVVHICSHEQSLFVVEH